VSSLDGFVMTFRVLTAHRRLASNSDRQDFFTKVLEGRKDNDISELQIAAHASDFVYGAMLNSFH